LRQVVALSMVTLLVAGCATEAADRSPSAQPSFAGTRFHSGFGYVAIVPPGWTAQETAIEDMFRTPDSTVTIRAWSEGEAVATLEQAAAVFDANRRDDCAPFASPDRVPIGDRLGLLTRWDCGPTYVEHLVTVHNGMDLSMRTESRVEHERDARAAMQEFLDRVHFSGSSD
jgi:hypothetical protein